MAARIGAPQRPVAIAAGSMLAALALAALLLAIWLPAVEQRAEARVLIVPAKTSGDVPVTSLDTLSRGTVVETFAQVFASPTIKRRAFASAGLPAATTEDVDVEASVLSGTAIVRIVATARDGNAAEAAADALAGYRPDLAGYSAAFRPLLLVDAAGTAEPAGPSRLFLSLALVATALINVIGVIVLLRRRRRPPPRETAVRSVEEQATPRISSRR